MSKHDHRDYSAAVSRIPPKNFAESLPGVLFDAIEDGMNGTQQFERYRQCRVNGCSRKLAAMLATRSFPGVRTDSAFSAGMLGDAGKLGVEQEWLSKQAEAVGVSTQGKWYCRGLASFPGDPTAWVGSRGEVLEVARAKGMKVSGGVEYTPPDWDDNNARAREEFESSQCRPAADLVADHARAFLIDNPTVDPVVAHEIAAEALSPREDYANLCVKDEPQVIPGPSI